MIGVVASMNEPAGLSFEKTEKPCRAVVIIRALFELPVKSRHIFVTLMSYTVNRILVVKVCCSGARAIVRA